MANPPKIFVSYSHKDKEWLKRLQVHFKALERDGSVDLWDDTEIKFGADWDSEIAGAVESAKAAILLVSADFLASDYIVNEELKNLLEAGGKKGLLNLMLILRPCVLGKLARFQSVNDPEEPLEGMSKVEQEKVFVKLVETIKKVLTVEPLTKKPEPHDLEDFQKGTIPRVKLKILHKESSSQPPNVRIFHQELITIGRDPMNDLVLSDPIKQVISKQHAAITSDHEQIYVTDLNSMNLTHLNKERLHPHQSYEIHADSIIEIGPFEISIERLDTKPDEDRTCIDTINPYTDDVHQLVTVLRRIGEQYAKETSRRHQAMLENALTNAMTDKERNEAYLLIARWLLKDVENCSEPS